MGKRQDFGKEKLTDQIKEDLNLFLRSRASDPRVKFVSVTRVELSPDFSQAKVFWDTYDPSIRGDAKKSLSGMSSAMRRFLSQKLNLRHTPSIALEYDEQYEAEGHIERLLNAEKNKNLD